MSANFDLAVARTRVLLLALCDEVERLREEADLRVSLLREVTEENTKLRAMLDRRLEGGVP
jgi:hypothetical protein